MVMKRILGIFFLFLIFVPLLPFFIYRTYGNKKYQLSRNTILICNHYSNFDPIFIQLKFFTKKIRFVALKIPKRKLFLRLITWLFDCIYVDPDKVNLNFYKTAIKSLNRGDILCIFPEGVVNPRKVGFFDFKEAYLRLGKKTKSKIVPLYLYPDLRPFRKTKLYIGQEIDIDGDDQTLDELNTNIMSLIMDYQASLD